MTSSRNTYFSLNCRKNDAIIQRKIDRGIWLPSMDTGHIYSTDKHANLKEGITNSGYSYVSKRDILVSRIVWIAAHGIPEPDMEVDHINGNKQDNRLANLQLVTHQENSEKANGLLTFDDAEHIRKARKEGRTQRSLAKEYGVSERTISRILARTTYKTCPPHEQHQKRAQHQIEKLDSETLAQICREHQRGASYSQIAAHWHITIMAVKSIIRGGGRP